MQKESQLMQNQEIFNDIDQAGELMKKQLVELSAKLKRNFDTHIQSAKFEAAYAITVNKAQRNKTMNEVKEVRNDLWKQALDKAKGDTKKAYVFYDELCDFP